MRLIEGYIGSVRYTLKIKALLITLLMLVATGCSAGASVENLLAPPKLDGQQNDIYQALINSTGSSIKLKYPKSGDYRSPFVVRNIDNEPGEEAMVFYAPDSVQTGEAALRLKFLDQYDGKWQVVYDLACIGTEVESLSFTSIGEGFGEDILLRTSVLNQTEKVLTVISYADGTPKELYASPYSCLEVFDLNNDANDELVTVVTDKTTGISTAMLFARTESGLSKLSQTELVGTHSEIINVTKGFLSESVPALYIDHSRGQGQYGTSVVYCSGDRIVSPDSIGANADSSIVSRFTNDYMADIHCTDIEGDGFVEIPSMVPLPGYEALPRAEQLCAVRWYTVEREDFVSEHYGYYSSKFKFALLFPDRWHGVVTAVPNLQENEIIFIGYTPETGLEVNESTELMRIKIVDKSDTQTSVANAIILGETEESIYCCFETGTYKTSKLALTASELEDSFIILTER